MNISRGFYINYMAVLITLSGCIGDKSKQNNQASSPETPSAVTTPPPPATPPSSTPNTDPNAKALAPTQLSPANNASLNFSSDGVTLSWTQPDDVSTFLIRVKDLDESNARDPRNNCNHGMYLCLDGHKAEKVNGKFSIKLSVKAGHRYEFWVHSAKHNFKLSDANTYSVKSSTQFSIKAAVSAPPPPTVPPSNPPSNPPAPPAASGQNKCVNPSGSAGCFSSITACLNQSSAGDTCTVQSGTYPETINPSKIVSPLRPIKVAAASGAEVNVNGVNLDSANAIAISGIKFKSMTRDKITWNFSSYYLGGTYVNDDLWVKGPVTVNSITTTEETFTWNVRKQCGAVGDNVSIPGFPGTYKCEYATKWITATFSNTATPNCMSRRGGSMIDMDPSLLTTPQAGDLEYSVQGLDEGSPTNQFHTVMQYDNNLNVALQLPKTLAATNSNKVLSLLSVCSSVGIPKPRFSRNAVLTVVNSIPHSTEFRPYYGGPVKGEVGIRFQDINFDLLKNLTTPSGASLPNADALTSALKLLIIEKDGAWDGETNTQFKRINGLSYGREISYATGDASLFLHSNASREEKAKVAVVLLQYGLDILASVENKMAFRGNGGHMHGRLVPLYFAVRMLGLGNSKISTYSPRFQEVMQHTYVQHEGKTLPEWGSNGGQNHPYIAWNATGYRQVNGSTNVTALLAMMLMDGSRNNVKIMLGGHTKSNAFVDYLLDVYFPIETSRPKISIRSETPEVGVGSSTNKIRLYTKVMWDAYMPN